MTTGAAAEDLEPGPDESGDEFGEEFDPFDENLSPWYGDLAEDVRPPEATDEPSQDVPMPEAPTPDSLQTGACPDLDGPVSRTEELRSSLYVPPLLDEGVPAPIYGRRRRGRRLVRRDEKSSRFFTPEQRLLLLDTWQRSALPAKDFGGLVGVSPHTLYGWKKKFEDHGPAGLMDGKRGRREGSRLPEVTKRAILMLKQGNPEFGCRRISDMLVRGPALPASPTAVARVLHEAGYVLEDVATSPHHDRVRRFERAVPNQLWQTDLFTFILKRQNRRVYLVAFMDDHSRFIVGHGLHASQSTALVLEALRGAITSYGTPEEILTDNGAQYVTWRGKSAFTKECEKRGIRQIVARPRRPQTLGKVERFWGTLWRECLQTAVFTDLGDARTRIGHFLDYYNFQRTHTGVGGLVPADRFFGAAPEMLRTLKERVAANALEIARNGAPKTPFYLTGNVGGRSFSVHAEGERLLLRRADGEPTEIELASMGPASAGEPVSARQPGDEEEDRALSGGVACDDPEPVGDGVDGAGESADEETPASTEEEADDATPSLLSDRVRSICESLRDAGDDEGDGEGGAQ